MEELEQGKYFNKEMVQDFNDLDIVILESVYDGYNAREHMEYWKQYFLDSGYTMYGKINYNKYHTKLTVIGIDKVLVEIVHQRRDKKEVVGIFDCKQDAVEFIRDYYSPDTNIHMFKVYANNKATREWIQEWNTRHIPVDRFKSIEIED